MYLQLTLILCFLCNCATSQQLSDTALIRLTSLNYMQGWYTGNVDKIKGALHPDMAKRQIVTVDKATNKQYVATASTDMMLQLTLLDFGKKFKGAKGDIEYLLLDNTDQLAMVRLKTLDYLDYLQLGKVNGEWKIINVLWSPGR
jgi:hypothetical protein